MRNFLAAALFFIPACQPILANADPGVSSVACSTTSATVAAVYGSRKNLIVYNDDTKNLRLKFGSGASTTSFTVLLLPGAYWEMAPMPIYNGLVAGIWEAACTGSARVTEQ